MSLYINPHVKVSEAANFSVQIPPDTTINNSSTSSESGLWKEIAGNVRAAAIGVVGNIAGSQTFNVRLRQAKDNTGASAKNLATTSFTTSGNTDVTLVVEATDRDMDTASGFTHVGVQLEHDEGSSLNVCGLLALVPYRR